LSDLGKRADTRDEKSRAEPYGSLLSDEGDGDHSEDSCSEEDPGGEPIGDSNTPESESDKKGNKVTGETRAASESDVYAKTFRRFGSLTYYLNEPREKVKKLELKYTKAVFLGFQGDSSSWLMGHWNEDARTKSGSRWTETWSKDCKFLENVMVRHLDQLRPTDKTLDNLVEGGMLRPCST
jgi:hypothetical protein